MNHNSKPNLDRDRDPNPAGEPAGVPANDNGGAIAPASSGGAMTALASLGTMLNKVDIAGTAGRSGLQMMSFKARDNNGTFAYGQKKTMPEADSLWAVSPTSFKWGFISFDEKNKPTERLVSISQPKPNVAELPDTGFKWDEQFAVNMKCTNGADAGVEVTFKASTVGGTQAVAGLIETIRDRLNSGSHDGKIVPIVRLERDSYPHSEYGRTWFPVFAIADWMPLDGPATAPTSPPPPTPPTSTASAAEQPRRRRVS